MLEISFVEGIQTNVFGILILFSCFNRDIHSQTVFTNGSKRRRKEKQSLNMSRQSLKTVVSRGLPKLGLYNL